MTLVQPPVDSVSFQQSHSTTSISEISDPVISDNVFNNHTLLSLNYSAGNSAMVLETLIRAQDLLEARDRNRKNKEKGEQVSDTYILKLFHQNGIIFFTGNIVLTT